MLFTVHLEKEYCHETYVMIEIPTKLKLFGSKYSLSP